MKKTLLIFRIFFLLISLLGCVLISYQVPEWSLWLVIFVGMSMASLVILIDLLLRGFSLRGLSGITFGLVIGGTIAYLLGTSPLFEPLEGDPELAQMLYLARLALYVISMYLATVIALRGKDEFDLVIPYVRFSPENVETPLVVVDTSALIDGRIAPICESKWMGHALLIPRFVLDELQAIADSPDPIRKEKGRKGLDILNRLRKMKHLDLRIHESDVLDVQAVDSKLVFLAVSMKAKLLTTDYNLAKLAEFHEVEWLNITTLVKALNQKVSIGTLVNVELVRAGKDAGQAIGYLSDGSMLVVNGGSSQIGKEVQVEVDSVVPSAGGKMIFATYRPDVAVA
ncbi:MAG: TRAM domain-containing protein [Opitutae bacterium]|jgi:uncharacterized protein YacL|nr:TRAM domain-containing protein [Opitutae bacterium]